MRVAWINRRFQCPGRKHGRAVPGLGVWETTLQPHPARCFGAFKYLVGHRALNPQGIGIARCAWGAWLSVLLRTWKATESGSRFAYTRSCCRMPLMATKRPCAAQLWAAGTTTTALRMTSGHKRFNDLAQPTARTIPPMLRSKPSRAGRLLAEAASSQKAPRFH